MSEDTELAVTPAEETVDPTTKIEMPTTESPAEVEEPKNEAATEEAAKEETTEEETEEPKKRVPGSQRLKHKLQLVEAEFLELQRETERLRQAAQQVKPPEDAKPGVDREPKESDFPNDWIAFQEARTAWVARQAIRDEFNRVRDEDRRTSSDRVRTERTRELLANYQEYADEVRERVPDFDKVLATANTVQIKPELVEELLASEKSALLQYHLAKNPDKAKELNELSGRELAREIGRLEARVHLPQAKKATEASPPPKEVKGAASPPVDPQAGPDDMNAYVAWRKKQMEKAS